LEATQPAVQEAEHHLELEAPPETLLVDVDAARMQQVLFNLIGNAIKYTPEGGKVAILLQESDSQVTATIADTGIGIPAEDLPLLFGEFFRARNAKKSGIGGTGLGLSIVRQLVERFGGHIGVESREDQGTTFTVSLQRVQPGGQGLF
jgi:signal transduction histidine kinase